MMLSSIAQLNNEIDEGIILEPPKLLHQANRFNNHEKDDKDGKGRVDLKNYINEAEVGIKDNNNEEKQSGSGVNSSSTDGGEYDVRPADNLTDAQAHSIDACKNGICSQQATAANNDCIDDSRTMAATADALLTELAQHEKYPVNLMYDTATDMTADHHHNHTIGSTCINNSHEGHNKYDQKDIGQRTSCGSNNNARCEEEDDGLEGGGSPPIICDAICLRPGDTNSAKVQACSNTDHHYSTHNAQTKEEKGVSVETALSSSLAEHLLDNARFFIRKGLGLSHLDGNHHTNSSDFTGSTGITLSCGAGVGQTNNNKKASISKDDEEEDNLDNTKKVSDPISQRRDEEFCKEVNVLAEKDGRDNGDILSDISSEFGYEEFATSFFNNDESDMTNNSNMHLDYYYDDDFVLRSRLIRNCEKNNSPSNSSHLPSVLRKTTTIDGSLINRSGGINILKDFVSSTSKPRHRVKFSTLNIREYPVVKGDHPCCRIGPSLEIGWYVSHETPNIPIDFFEALRTPKWMIRTKEEQESVSKYFIAFNMDEETMKLPRRPRRQLRLSPYTRQKWLDVDDHSYSNNSEIHNAKVDIEAVEENSSSHDNPVTIDDDEDASASLLVSSTTTLFNCDDSDDDDDDTNIKLVFGIDSSKNNIAQKHIVTASSEVTNCRTNMEGNQNKAFEDLSQKARSVTPSPTPPDIKESTAASANMSDGRRQRRRRRGAIVSTPIHQQQHPFVGMSEGQNQHPPSPSLLRKTKKSRGSIELLSNEEDEDEVEIDLEALVANMLHQSDDGNDLDGDVTFHKEDGIGSLPFMSDSADCSTKLNVNQETTLSAETVVDDAFVVPTMVVIEMDE